ncbi:hypothetical protein SAMN05428978_104013 [Nitrosomonas sp. Nm34]|nr:hypothetical protein SAMN05428978_104013 [Nitrosomonas sp. Nm34]
MGIFQSAFSKIPFPNKANTSIQAYFIRQFFQHPSQWMFTSISIEGDQFQAIATFFILTRLPINKQKEA